MLIFKFKKYIHIIVILLLNSFFIFHFFTGEFGILEHNKRKVQFTQLLQTNHNLQNQQKILQHQINYLQKSINIDYLETIALNKFNRVSKMSKIYQVSIPENQLI